MDAQTLKVLAAISSLIGSGLLAWRVTGILRAIGFVAEVHEANIAQLMDRTGDITYLANAPQHIERSQRLWLLWLGFFFMGLSGVLQLVSLII